MMTARPSARPSARPAFKPLAAILLLGLTPALAACSVAVAQDAAAPETEDAEETPTAREEGGRQCFYIEQVSGFRTAKDEDGRRSDTRILVDVRASDTFELELMHRCPEVRWANDIGFRQTGSGRVCDGLDVDLIVPDSTLGPQRCPVVGVRKLAPGEPGARAGSRD